MVTLDFDYVCRKRFGYSKVEYVIDDFLIYVNLFDYANGLGNNGYVNAKMYCNLLL